MKSQMNILQLAYPPISNQEAEWVKDDPEVQEVLSHSNLYMICHRAEAFFEFAGEILLEILRLEVIPFKIICNGAVDSGVFKLKELLESHNIDYDKFETEIETGPKLLRIWKVSIETGEKEIIDWFTVDKTIYNKWRCHRFIGGLENYRKFTRFTLHYVGISKKEDSLTRLVRRGHEKRVKVLSNEYPINEGSRVTDEIILLFFSVNPLRISQIETDYDIEDFINSQKIDTIPIIADAEKAFVSVLNSQYNTIKFKEYPRGGDGLYDSGLTSYLYMIGESLTLVTEKDEIRGDYTSIDAWNEGSDSILIKGDEVIVIKYDEISSNDKVGLG